jgi:P-type E1-E2 ATPase
VAEELRRASNLPQLFESVRGGVTPEEKLARIREIQGLGVSVAMVGDGVNDAGALAVSDVGIAVTGAAEASRMSADVYLAEAGVAQVVRLFSGSERTLQTIRRGLLFSLLYNGLGITAAAFGVIGPLLAAVLMPLSSLTVVTNAYRSRTFSLRDHS